ncbi:hypothetical protein BHE74_00055906 [Ensete ventricosum]|nr:hypothetical protein BHE74_00055906 [Ensete ventricosum]RZS15768.1 hypothetical protein BHM03_00047645 [Ensete ventricosum]
MKAQRLASYSTSSYALLISPPTDPTGYSSKPVVVARCRHHHLTDISMSNWKRPKHHSLNPRKK